MIVNIYVPNISTPHLIKNKTGHKGTDRAQFNNSGRSSRLPLPKKKKRNRVKKEIELNYTVDPLDFNNYRIVHPVTTEYTFFSAANGIFSKMEHMLGCKAGLNNTRKTKIFFSSYQIIIECK
jgi:hypothetical protein